MVILIAGSPLDDPIFGRRKQVAQPKPHEELDNGSGQGAVNPSGSPLSPSNDIVKIGNGEYKSSTLLPSDRMWIIYSTLSHLSAHIRKDVNCNHASFS